MQEHKSRFKAFLVPPSSLAEEATRLQKQLRSLNDLGEKLTDPEKVLLFIFIYAEERLPNQWWMSRGSNKFESETGFAFSNLPESFDFLKRVSAGNLTEFCTRYDFKKLPAAVVRSIFEWSLGKNKLILKSAPISPLEMLAAQARGERVVTLDFDSALAGRLVDGRRDCLEFLLHDLVHADLFFGDGHSEQVEFFRNFHAAFSLDCIDGAMRSNTEYAADINYLMSDMNSHVGHMQAHLKASLTKHHLYSENKKPFETLSDKGREELERQWALLNNLIFPQGGQNGIVLR